MAWGVRATDLILAWRACRSGPSSAALAEPATNDSNATHDAIPVKRFMTISLTTVVVKWAVPTLHNFAIAPVEPAAFPLHAANPDVFSLSAHPTHFARCSPTAAWALTLTRRDGRAN
jgi:hypothetical protein